jgi:hypothetical protein
VRTSSAKVTSPTRSPARPAAAASSAAACAAAASLLRPVVPKPIEADTSSSRSTVWARSSRKRFTHGSPLRAVAFQSIERTSSPGA